MIEACILILYSNLHNENPHLLFYDGNYKDHRDCVVIILQYNKLRPNVLEEVIPSLFLANHANYM